MFNLKSILVLLAICTTSLAHVVDFKPCEVNDCEIHEVRVNPCPEAENHIACKVHRRRRGTYDLSYDYTPHFDAETVEQAVFWVKSETEQLPLVSLDKNGCPSTTCPLVKNVRKTVDLPIPVDRKFPLGSYHIKWVLGDLKGKQCCFTMNISVVN